MSYKTNDKKYSVIELSGFIFIPFNECLKKRDEINKEIESIFENSEKQVTGNTNTFRENNTKSITIGHRNI